jgi:hypothetical protein
MIFGFAEQFGLVLAALDDEIRALTSIAVRRLRL